MNMNRFKVIGPDGVAIRNSAAPEMPKTPEPNDYSHVSFYYRETEQYFICLVDTARPVAYEMYREDHARCEHPKAISQDRSPAQINYRTNYMSVISSAGRWMEPTLTRQEALIRLTLPAVERILKLYPGLWSEGQVILRRKQG